MKKSKMEELKKFKKIQKLTIYIQTTPWTEKIPSVSNLIFFLCDGPNTQLDLG